MIEKSLSDVVAGAALDAGGDERVGGVRDFVVAVRGGALVALSVVGQRGAEQRRAARGVEHVPDAVAREHEHGVLLAGAQLLAVQDGERADGRDGARRGVRRVRARFVLKVAQRATRRQLGRDLTYSRAYEMRTADCNTFYIQRVGCSQTPRVVVVVRKSERLRLRKCVGGLLREKGVLLWSDARPAC